MRTIDLPVGATTAIGSLPHRHVDAAIAVALAASPDLPAAPSLPALDRREGMLAQAAWGMAGVEVERDGSLRVVGPLDPQTPFADAAGLDQAPFRTLTVFLDEVVHRTGPIKLQLTGPVTLGMALVHAGAPVDVAFEAAAAAVRHRALQLVARAIAHAPAAPLYVFIDEPGLSMLSEASFPLDRDDAVDLVSGALATLEPHAVTGLHCCGDTDWRLALFAGPQILSLPLASNVVDHAGALSVHLERGGWLAWGVVPTSRPVGSDAGPLWRRLADTWCALVQHGADPLRLREQALVTPECGLANHDSVQAELLLALSSELADRVRRQAFGARLSVGA